MSLSRLVVAVLICVNAVVSPASSVSCAFQIFSGPSAAVTAEFTAEVTSMPADDAPVAASRIELMSTEVVELDEPSRELSKELVLIKCVPSLRSWWQPVTREEPGDHLLHDHTIGSLNVKLQVYLETVASSGCHRFEED